MQSKVHAVQTQNDLNIQMFNMYEIIYKFIEVVVSTCQTRTYKSILFDSAKCKVYFESH